MTNQEADLVRRVAQEVADALRPRIHELERENDRLIGEIRVARRQHAATRERLEQEVASARAEADQERRRTAELESLLAEATKPTLSIEEADSAAA